MPTPRAQTSNVLDGKSALAVVAVAVLIIAWIDLRAAAVALLFLCPALALAGADKARFELRSIVPDEAGAWAGQLARAGQIQLVEVHGAMSFLSVPGIDRIIPERPPWPRYLIVDLRAVTAIDASALRALRDVLDALVAADGAWLLLCGPQHAAWRALQGAGLPSSALGGTSCFTLRHAFERIAQRHPTVAAESVQSAAATPRLYLVRQAADAGE